MTDKTTTAELFELAISIEKVAETFYQQLATMFAHNQEIADFWTDYAQEEAMHGQWLKRIKDSLSHTQLTAPSDPDQLKNARKALQFSIESALAEVKDLEDAYQLVNEIENSETNAVFEFLISKFSADEKVQSFLRSQLRTHITKLMLDLPAQFKHAANRRTLKVAD